VFNFSLDLYRQLHSRVEQSGRKYYLDNVGEITTVVSFFVF